MQRTPCIVPAQIEELVELFSNSMGLKETNKQKKIIMETVLICKCHNFLSVFIQWQWYFPNNRVDTSFLSGMHFLLRRQHLQFASPEEHNRCRVHDPVPPQQHKRTFLSHNADSRVPLVGVPVIASPCAAPRGTQA